MMRPSDEESVSVVPVFTIAGKDDNPTVLPYFENRFTLELDVTIKKLSGFITTEGKGLLYELSEDKRHPARFIGIELLFFNSIYSALGN